MAKTALELTPEELRSYDPTARSGRARAIERREQALEVARAAARLLRDEFNAKRVVAFGSIVDRDAFAPWSDIDLAAWGIPPDQYFRAVGAVSAISPDFQVDLIDPEDRPTSLRQQIEGEGAEL